MATSAVPGAIAALLAMLRSESGLSGVQVVDGPPTDDQSDADLIAVGWSLEGDLAAEVVQEFNAAGARTRDENFDIACWLDTWSGDHDFAACRARAYELLAVVENAIRASGASPTAPTLNGAVQWAHLTRYTLRQSLTDQGAQVSVPFTITCRARI